MRSRRRRRTPPRRHAQQGVVVLMFALSLTLLMGFAGLALDGARLYVNKAELQNAADACALAAAQELNPTGGAPGLAGFTRARAAGVLAATRNRSDFQSQPVPGDDVAVEFAAAAVGATWRVFDAAQATDLVARCTVTPTALTLWFLPVLGFADVEVGAVAAATRDIAGNNCAPGPGLCPDVASLVQ
jgi:Flp pilus assembly protein TadG